MSSERKKLVFDLLKQPTYNLGRTIRWSGVISEIENELDKNKDLRSYEKKVLLLNGFYLVNLVALWQVFIEDLIEYGCDLIERNIDSNPEKLLHKISLDRSKTALKKFNTPDRGRIDQIFLDCFGVKNITECWKKEDGNFVAEYDVLVSVLRTRHCFVHTGRLDRELSFNDSNKFAEDIFNLAKLLQDKLIAELGDYDIK